MKRIKQLDSLRAIAIVLVILHHLPSKSSFSLLDNYPLGANLFFVLSGYLITSVLLHEKNKAALLGTPKGKLFQNFAAKRALRIFPLYFLVVGSVCWYYSTPLPFTLSLATFTFNFYVFFQQDWNFIAHIWSLSVQEHFYLLWPLVVLATSRKSLLYAILFFIALGIVFQQVLFPGEFGTVLTPSCFDALGAGALLAWLHTYRHTHFAAVYNWVGIAALCSLLVIVVCGVAQVGLPLPFRTLYAVVVMWLIAYVLYKKERGILNHRYLLGNPALQFIGNISFGLYLLHPILPNFTYWPLDKINRMLLPAELYVHNSTIILIQDSLILLVAASLCYWVIEQPFMRLKKHFVQKSKGLQPGVLPLKGVSVLNLDALPTATVPSAKG